MIFGGNRYRDPVNEKSSFVQKIFSSSKEIHSIQKENNPDFVCSSNEKDDCIVKIFSKNEKTWAELWDWLI